MKMQNVRSPGKLSLLGAIVASVCIVIYLVAIVSATIRIYISVDQRRTTAEREFVNIADLASSAGTLGFMNEIFIETVNDALTSSRTLEALIISGPDGEYAFERQPERSVRWVNNSPRFIRRFDHSRQNLFMPLRIQGLRNVNIQGVAGAIDYSQVGQILRETLIIIMGGLILAFFTLLMEYMLGRSGKRPSFQPIINQKNFRRRDRTASAGVAQFTGKTAAKSEDSVEAEEELAEEQPIENEVVQEVEEKESSISKGLYSPRTNVCFEKHLNERLQSELHRCASLEQDLTLISMEFKDAYDDGFMKVFAGDVAAFFGTKKDLLFEKGKQGISVINPEMNIETGIVKAEEFHTRIMDRYSTVLKSKTDFYIGLTSRNGRLVTAFRMIFEADEAIKRAKSNETPILAFKSDPDKYRAFIRKSSK